MHLLNACIHSPGPIPIVSYHLMGPILIPLSEEIAHPTRYHHLSQISVDIQWNGLIKCREQSSASDPHDLRFTQLDQLESAALRQWTSVISSLIN